MFHIQLVKISSIDSLEELQVLLNQSRNLNQDVCHPDWPEEDQLEKGWRESSNFRMVISQLTSGTQEEVNFIYAQSYNERKKQREKWYSNGELLPKTERINSSIVNTIFFKHEQGIYAAPIMPSSANINTFCDDLFPMERWGVIERYPIEFRLNRDFFYWVLNCYTRENGRISPNIKIRTWTAYNGRTQDSLHRLTGDGDRISALLGTLAFLYMGDPFKSLSLCIQYNEERIPLTLWEFGNLDINDYEYEGVYSNRYLDEQRKVMLTNLMYTKVLPELLYCYNQAIVEGRWSTAIMEEFKTWIGDIIVSRVKPTAI